MKTTFIKLLLFSITIILYSCECEEEPIKGCTNSKAINKDINAEVDDGSCVYSSVAFYSSASFFNGIPISKVDLNINGNHIGSTNGTFYPNGPGNCSAPGTVPFKFSNSNSVDWNATVFLANGATIITSGTASPNSIYDCIKINLTK